MRTVTLSPEVKFLFLPSNLSDGKKTDLSLRVAISMSMGVPGGVGVGGGVDTGVVVGVAPKLGGNFSNDGSGVISLKGFWGDITTRNLKSQMKRQNHLNCYQPNL